MKTITFSLLLLQTQQAFAQFADNFADGDFSSNPLWAGTDSKFIISSGRLKLQAPAVADVAYLSVNSAGINNASWEFFTRIEFNPSSSNYARIYLVSDNSDLSASLNGYFVAIGSASDEISLYRQTGASITEIIDGLDNRLNVSFADMKIKVTRDDAGNWSLYTDVGQSGNYTLEGSAFDSAVIASTYCGVYCVYTATRSDKFYFDDFAVTGDPFVDHTPPTLQSISVLSSTELLVTFSEAVDAINSAQLDHYFVADLGNPVNAVQQADLTQVKITFAESFQNGYESTFNVSGISDVTGNFITPSEEVFLYFQASPVSYRDVIISEFFPDYTPKIGLPEAEFVEIYNRSTNPIDLANWKITDKNSIGVLSSMIILPGDYVILSTATAQPLFNDFGRTVAVSNFPTLNNSGDFLLLRDNNNQPVDSLEYTLDWYRDEDKQQGGWTLERMDPENICAVDNNWSASIHESGGTPGQVNSVNQTIVDVEGPKPINATQLSDHEIEIRFNEKLDLALPSLSQITFSPTATVSNLEFTDATLEKVKLSLADSIPDGKTYLITLSGFYDCPGNLIEEEIKQVYLNLDTIGPAVDSIAILDSTSILIRFDERVLEDGAVNTENYRMLSGINCSDVQLSNDEKTVTVTFSDAFQNGFEQTLILSGIHDINSNSVTDSVKFTYFVPGVVSARDVIITEIFPDPSPVIGLPDAEFVEIFNRSDDPIDLANWILTDRSSVGKLPSKILLPGRYLILTANGSVQRFEQYGDVIGVSNFPTLNNSGDTLVLNDSHNLSVDSLKYSSAWYQDEDKDAGGWTIELRDPENFCLGDLNWTSSVSITGGTPGFENSVNESVVDQTPPRLVSAISENDSSILISFDERLQAVLPSKSDIKILPDVEVDSISFTNRSLKDIFIKLKSSIETGRTYNIKLENVSDCSGNVMLTGNVYLNFDTIPPTISSVDVLSANSLYVTYREKVIDGDNKVNYHTQSDNHPIEAILSDDEHSVTLFFENDFLNGINDKLFASNIADINGNLAHDTVEFVYFHGAPVANRDIIITEIFPDPSPVVALPEAEFVEIYNRSTNPIQLDGWKLTDGTTTAKMPHKVMIPGEYLIITAFNSFSKYSAFGETVSVTTFPSLNNSGDDIVLKDSSGATIDSIHYVSSWYHNSDKNDGGWTLERINYEDICHDAENWTASMDTIYGGTPGKINSVFSDRPDVEGPKLVSVNWIDSLTLEMKFNEKLQSTIPTATFVEIQPSILIDSIKYADLSFSSLRVISKIPLDERKTYEFTVNELADCTGNTIDVRENKGYLHLDTIPPAVEVLTVISDHALAVEFSERLAFDFDATNFSIGDEHPDKLFVNNSGDSLTLVFKNGFANGEEQKLAIKNLQDINGNTTGELGLLFMFFDEKPTFQNDIIITEIFADPSPVIGLPEAEFVEVFNRSENPVTLQSWTLTDGSSVGKISTGVILPGEYAILCPSSAVSNFKLFGKTFSVTNFPSLNNSGDMLLLKNKLGIVIDSVNYADSWYQNENASEGGFTLELIDPENLCAEEQNWIASESEVGGTPGQQNSVFANKPDLTAPELVSAIPYSDHSLVMSFNEKLDRQLPDPSSFIINDLAVISVAFSRPDLREITIEIGGIFESGKHYRVRIAKIRDCAGNEISSEKNFADFGLPENAHPGEILINEILFNPRPNGVDFIELYNNSGKFFNLRNLQLANIDNDTLKNFRPISDVDILIGPGEYIVLTTNPSIIQSEYLQANESALLQVRSLPSMNDDEGHVAIIDTSKNVIDHLYYTDKFHSVFIRDDQGVSLERVSISEGSNNSSNWKSASEQSGFATPGYINSNSIQRSSIDTGSVIVEPEVFEPNGNSPAFTTINYRFDRGGFIGNLKIFDSQGREVKNVAENQLLGTEGFFRWDGDENNGTKARIGTYMIWLQVFDAQGSIQTFRKEVVVAGQFK